MVQKNDRNGLKISLSEFLLLDTERQLGFLHTLGRDERIRFERDLPEKVKGALITLEVERARSRIIAQRRKRPISREGQQKKGPTSEVKNLPNLPSTKSPGIKQVYIIPAEPVQAAADELLAPIDAEIAPDAGAQEIADKEPEVLIEAGVVQEQINELIPDGEMLLSGQEDEGSRTGQPAAEQALRNENREANGDLSSKLKQFLRRSRWLWPVLLLASAVLAFGGAYFLPALDPGVSQAPIILLVVFGFLAIAIWFWMIGE